MTPDDKHQLRLLRDDMDNPDDRKLIRKTINYIHLLERKMDAIRTLLRLANTEASTSATTKDTDDGNVL